MSIKKVLEFEKRTEENLYNINFFYEDGWWRAYEMSAYLCNHLENNEPNTNILNPTKHILKDKTEYISVGLKLSSFNKYFPNIDFNKKENYINDTHMVINVEDLYQKEDLDSLINKFNQWKSDIPLKEKKEKDKQSKNEYSTSNINNEIKQITLFNISQKILSYPIYDKTPNENTQFILKLKQEIISLII